MTKRNPMCIIKGCNHRGKRKVRIDIGPTLGDAIVDPKARIHTVMVCQEHLDLMAGGKELHYEEYSIGER